MLIRDFVAIDPLALLLSSAAYQRIIEKVHPHVPKVADIAAALEGASKADLEATASRADALAEYARSVKAAVKQLGG